MITTEAIRPELVAAKLASAENLESVELASQLDAEPRLVELLWFVQWSSFQPGGIGKLASDLRAAFPGRFQADCLREAKVGQDGGYSLDEFIRICKKLRRSAFGDHDEFDRWLDGYFPPEITSEDVQNGVNCNQEKFLEGWRRFTPDYFRAVCEDWAESRLPRLLMDYCVNKSEIKPPWYCPDLLQLLFSFMDRHASEAEARLARTVVVDQVFDALDFAWAEKKLVRIDGNARFGKTEAVRTWCFKYPGRARLFSVPCSNSEADLFRAIAAALGIAVDFGSRGVDLRDKVEFILRHGKLGIVADESHFLFPVRYGKHTVPMRLNWFRTQVVDRRLPCALVTTPQSYDGQSGRFGRATGYTLEQFVGRVTMCVKLPEVLDKSDLYAVAQFHFPAFGDRQHQAIVGAAMFSSSYLKAVEDIASRARWIARRRKSEAVSVEDVMAAIGDVIPDVGKVVSKPSAQDTAAPARSRRLTPAEAAQQCRPGGRQTISSLDPAPQDAPRHGVELVAG